MEEARNRQALPWYRNVGLSTPEQRRHLLWLLLIGITIWGSVALTFLYFVAIL